MKLEPCDIYTASQAFYLEWIAFTTGFLLGGAIVAVCLRYTEISSAIARLVGGGY